MKISLNKIITISFSGIFLFAGIAHATSVFQTYQGGTGTSSVPAFGQVLVGQGDGTYGPQATSTLGITSGTSISTSTLTATSPLTGSFTQVGSGGTLGCQTASGSQAGCISSTDWTTFNSKQSALTFPLSILNGGTGLSSILAGFIPFGNGTSAIATDTNFFWDNTNKRLGLGTASPTDTFTLGASTTARVISGTNLNDQSENNPFIGLINTQNDSSFTRGARIYFTKDTYNSSQNALYIDAGEHNNRIFLGSPSYPSYALNLSNVNMLENPPTILFSKGKGLEWGDANNQFFTQDSGGGLTNSNVNVNEVYDYGAGDGAWTFKGTQSGINYLTILAGNGKGYVGIGTTTPSQKLVVIGTTTTSALNISNLTSTVLAVDSSHNVIATTTTNGTVTSVGVSSASSTLTIGSSPITTSGTITADLNLSHANTWTGAQTFGAATTTTLGIGSLQGILHGSSGSVDASSSLDFDTTNGNIVSGGSGLKGAIELKPASAAYNWMTISNNETGSNEGLHITKGVYPAAQDLFDISSAGNVTRYAGTVTAGVGVPYVVASANIIGGTGTTTAITYTAPASPANQLYILNQAFDGVGTINTFQTTATIFCPTYNSSYVSNINGPTAFIGGMTSNICLTAGSTFTLKVSFPTTGGSMTYDLLATLTRLY